MPVPPVPAMTTPAVPSSAHLPQLAQPIVPLPAAGEPPRRPSGRVPLPPPRQQARDTAPDAGLEQAFAARSDGESIVSGTEATVAAPPRPAPEVAELSTKALAEGADQLRTQWRLRRPTFPTRVFTPPDVTAMPKCPHSGLVAQARYTVAVLRARRVRRKAIAQLELGVVQETTALELVLGDLGRAARAAGVSNKALDEENNAITRAEQARETHGQKSVEITTRRNDEMARSSEVEHERLTQVSDAERRLAAAEREYERLDGERRKLRDHAKELGSRAAAYEKSATKREQEAARLGASDAATQLRHTVEQHRREAGILHSEHQEIDRKLAVIETPLGQARDAVRVARAELDSAKANLRDAREGHRQRLVELDAEQARNTAAFSQADGEIQRRLVTLGTLMNLHRLPAPDTEELFARVDRLKSMISAHAGEIEHLGNQRDGYDRPTFYRGIIAWCAALVVLFALVTLILVVT
ncbi:MAG: hypothetical protein IPL79_19080 [Myxococcales bacterium]|nr:hypothetical protein [Myxococcales bacterium]